MFPVLLWRLRPTTPVFLKHKWWWWWVCSNKLSPADPGGGVTFLSLGYRWCYFYVSFLWYVCCSLVPSWSVETMQLPATQWHRWRLVGQWLLGSLRPSLPPLSEGGNWPGWGKGLSQPIPPSSNTGMSIPLWAKTEGNLLAPWLIHV